MEINSTSESTRQQRNLMTTKIGWINGEWGSEKELFIPLLEKGITLGSGIFETILLFKGKPKLFKEHLERWHQSAKLLNMKQPPSQLFLAPLINEAIERISLTNGNGVLKLNWSRKDFIGQGINIANTNEESNNYYFWLEVNTSQPYFEVISTMISKNERRNAKSLISKCKSFGYLQSIQARHEAKMAGYDDALLLSTNGYMSCGTTSNLIVKRNNEWLTPHHNSGCLPGTMRQKGLALGKIKEAEIEGIPKDGDQWLLLNSLSLQPIQKINDRNLDIYPKPKNFWLSLLDD